MLGAQPTGMSGCLFETDQKLGLNFFGESPALRLYDTMKKVSAQEFWVVQKTSCEAKPLLGRVGKPEVSNQK